MNLVYESEDSWCTAGEARERAREKRGGGRRSPRRNRSENVHVKFEQFGGKAIYSRNERALLSDFTIFVEFLPFYLRRMSLL